MLANMRIGLFVVLLLSTVYIKPRSSVNMQLFWFVAKPPATVTLLLYAVLIDSKALDSGILYNVPLSLIDT